MAEFTVNENVDYSRQRAIPLTYPPYVFVVGCGGVGSWIAYFLALAGVQKLYLFDSDVVSSHNLNRSPWLPPSIGMKKTEATAALIKAARPHCAVECFPNFSPEFGNILIQAICHDHLENESRSWVVCSTDSWESRRICHKWKLNHHINYAEAAAEGEFGSIAGSPADFGTIEESLPGYASVPVWVGPAVSAAVMACSHILHDALNRDQVARFGWHGGKASIEFTYKNQEEI